MAVVSCKTMWKPTWDLSSVALRVESVQVELIESVRSLTVAVQLLREQDAGMWCRRI